MRKIVLLLFGLLPAALFGQTTPTNTAGFTIGTNRAMTRVQYLEILGDSLDAMESRLALGIADSAAAAVNRIISDSLPVMEARLQAELDDSLVEIEVRLFAAIGDTARDAVAAALTDSLPVMEARLYAIMIDSLNAIEGRVSAALYDSASTAASRAMSDSLPVMEARLMAWMQEQVDTTGIGLLSVRLEADSTRLAAESARNDSLSTASAAADSALDATQIGLYILPLVAGDTTSPGLFYALDTLTGQAVRADTSAEVRAFGVALDSVPAGNTVHVQYHGMVSAERWRGLITPGRRVVNDSISTGLPAPLDAGRDAAKKMQEYGEALDSVTIFLKFSDVWTWRD
jgi:hypothetical protein